MLEPPAAAAAAIKSSGFPPAIPRRALWSRSPQHTAQPRLSQGPPRSAASTTQPKEMHLPNTPLSTPERLAGARESPQAWAHQPAPSRARGFQLRSGRRLRSGHSGRQPLPPLRRTSATTRWPCATPTPSNSMF
eukprot:9476346-Pyramimonas_sp.AAC.1